MDKVDIVKICKEKGYVAFGYFSPDLKSDDEYPEYIESEVKRCIERVKSHQSKNSVSFAFITDIHYSDTPNHNVRTKRLVNAYKEIAKAGVSMLVLGGDHVNDGLKEYKENNYRKLREFFTGIEYLPINGNHDDNSIWDRFVENEKSVNHITTSELHALFFDHIDTECGKDGLYYFKDDKNKKVRYIVIDPYDLPEKYDENGKLVYLKQDDYAISQKQADWLVDKALMFDEDGWSIVLLSHFLPYPDKNTDEGREVDYINEILSSYQKGIDIHKTFGEGELSVKVDADFSARNKANILAVIMGHTHEDILQRDEANTPFIYRANAMMYDTAHHKRVDGTATELLFDIVTVDVKENKIYIDRVGAGENLYI